MNPVLKELLTVITLFDTKKTLRPILFKIKLRDKPLFYLSKGFT